MRRLPPYHVPRPRLSRLCAEARVVVIEAAGGYGKSVLGVELTDSWLAVGIEVQLDHGEVPADLLAARLRAAALQAGFSEAAATAAESGDDATAAVDSLLAALADERCAFVIDDSHNARADAGALIEHLATRLEGEQRLVVLARRLPKGAQRLRRADFLHLSSAELSMSPEETLQLCRSGFGLAVGPEVAAAIDRSTGGWTAATVLAVARASRTGDLAETLAAIPATEDHAAALAALLEEAVTNLGPERRPLLAQLARLPLLDPGIVDLVADEHGFFETSLSAGLPFVPANGPWWELPDPVREHLRTFSPPSQGAMRRAAEEYRRRGQLGPALQMLLACGEPGEAACLLAAASDEDREGLDALELQSVLDQLPAEVVEANPAVLLVVAKGHGVAFHYRQRVALIERAAALAARTGDEVLARAIDAEHANDLCREFAYDECERAARAVLAAAGDEERFTRARCYYTLARALLLRRKPDSPRDEGAITEAEDCFGRCAELYGVLGLRSVHSVILVETANLIDFENGCAEAALARLDAALELAADRPRRWAWAHCFRAKVAAELGLGDACRASVDAVLRVAEQYDDELFRAYGHRRLAMLAAYEHDAEATLNHIREAERHRADNWWGQASATFLAEAGDWLGRVGHTALAWEYLSRAAADPKDAGPEIAICEAVLEARDGDPVLAEQRLTAVVAGPVAPRELWRITLARAYAAFRRGEHGAAGALAARSFEEAARLGQPRLPMICERTMSEQLLGLAIDTGQPAALALEAGSLPISLTLLGQFAVAEAGRLLPLGPGMEAKLLKYVCVKGGRAHAEQAIEVLWPDAGSDAGRNRLRTVLSRLRAAVGDVVSREGDLLVLDAAVRVDLQDFLAEACRAQALAPADSRLATAVARGAMARYRGDLLPDDPYDEWAVEARQHARQVMLDLLDLCAAEAGRRGDLDALRRVVERTIELDPYDDRRYLRVASALLQQGRRGEALTIVRRARSALAEIGVDPPTPLLDLEHSIVA